MGEFFVWSAFLGTLLFLFPVFLGVDLFVDAFRNRAYFAVSFFGLRVFGGYGEVRHDCIAVHLTKNYAFLLPYDRMGDTKKYFEITDGFQLMKLHQVVETGGAGRPAGILLAAALQASGGAAFSVLRTRHPFLSLKNGTVLSKVSCLKLTAETVTVFNGLVLSLAIGKKSLEAFLNWIRNKKSTASSKRRQSSS